MRFWNESGSRAKSLLMCCLLLSALTGARVAAGTSQQKAPEEVYYPGAREAWQTRTPQESGMDADRLKEAIQFAVDSESSATRDLALDLALGQAREPYGEIVGPTRERGPLSGIILRHGYIVAEWGESRRVDMTFSVTKSFLSTLVGLAWDRKMIGDLNDRVGDYMPGEHFDSLHNAGITWDHMLRQTSDWQGTLWEKPDWADRPQGDDSSKWPERELHEPGSYWKYNDVRVNLLALAALHVWRKPLPQVLKEEVMDPIGASNTWRWHGYRNSWIVLDGLQMQSVSGGGHWGGGMWINARDLARFGYLSLRRGRWKDRQIISQRWIEMATTPTPANKTYGFMNWFLNTGRQGRIPSAPESSIVHLGSGTNAVYVDWENDLVVVVRWIQNNKLDGFIQRVLASIEGEP